MMLSTFIILLASTSYPFTRGSNACDEEEDQKNPEERRGSIARTQVRVGRVGRGSRCGGRIVCAFD